MPKMVTKKHHKYRAVTYKPGDTYDALNHDVETLRRTGWAEFHLEQPKKEKAITKKAAIDNTYETRHLEAE